MLNGNRPFVALVALLLSVLLVTPAFGAGFLLFEQGSKAMGMAGAFTAQADDGSAMFHNVAGLAFQDFAEGKERSFLAGITFVRPTESGFQGQAPFPGPTATGEQADQLFTVPHVYFARRLNSRWTFGLGVNAPFGLSTEWDNPETFAGRYISTRAELSAVDLNPSVAWRVNDELAVGFGAVIRLSEISLQRFIPQRNPFTGAVVDVGFANLESSFDEGFGFNVGALYKRPGGLSIGFSYRSKVDTDYAGAATLTQIPTGDDGFDALVAASVPFGVPLALSTSLEFPDMASLGVAYEISEKLLVEADVNWTGWSSFDVVELEFVTAPALSETIPENYEDAQNYRIGVRYDTSDSRQWRFGVYFDETPQPEETVGPLLPDADRYGVTIGYGTKRYDVALMYVQFDDRTTTTNHDNFFGTYEFTIVLLGGSIRF